MIRNWLSHLRARRPSTIRRPANRVQKRLQMEYLEDRSVPAVLDLTSQSFGFLNEGRFELIAQQPAGSGVIDSFVRLHDLGPDDTNTPEGHNTSGRNPGSPKLNFDENSSPVFTHNIQLQDIPVITIGTGKSAVTYREFRLDVNEPNNNPAVPVSLNKVKIFSSGTPNLLASPTNLATLGTLRWDMDGNTASASTQSGPDLDSEAPSPNGNWVKLNDVNHGSGQADMRLLVPNSAFAGVGKTDYIYFYSRFGDTRAMTGGYEEWYLGAPTKEQPVNVVTVIYQGDHGAGETPVPPPFIADLGSVVHDHATVTDLKGSPVTTGSVTFSFWTNIDCEGDPLWTYTDANGSDGWQSKSTPPLHAGSYSFAARYNGADGVFSPGTSECEPLTIAEGVLALDTLVKDANGNTVPDDAILKDGSQVKDTAFFVGTPPFPGGFVPTGSVTYKLFYGQYSDANGNGKFDFADATLNGHPQVQSQNVLLNPDGTIPDSSLTGALAPGYYYYLVFFDSTSSDYQDAYGIREEPFAVTGVARTQGYWKTHGPGSPGNQENAWPVANISIGGVSYTAAEAIAIMNASTEGNAISSLFQQLVAYKLNVLSFVIPTQEEIDAAAEADALIAQATGGAKLQVVSGNTLNFIVAPDSALGQQMIDAMSILTDFNESGV